MKRVLSLFLSVLLIFSLCACVGNYARVDLKKPVNLSEEGLVEGALLQQIKDENAIATFTGKSGDFGYEWTVFGSDIDECKDVVLAVDVEAVDGGIKIDFADNGELGFSGLLSVTLSEKWSALGATAYRDGVAVASVSITGSRVSVLNIPIREAHGSLIIQPNAEKGDGSGNDRPVSDGGATDQDKYLTDPVPEGKPLPVEPEDQEINKGKAYTCVISIECSTTLNNLADLDPDKLELIPSNGVILPPTEVTFYEGESVFDVLKRVCQENGIHLEFSWTPIYNSAYIEGIHNLYEFDCGALSGWMYRVDGWYPNYGCSRYQLADGEVIEWRYTCDLGRDVGCDWMQG